MKITTLRLVLVLVVAALVTSSVAVAATRHHRDHGPGNPGNAQFVAHLDGYQETPSINSGGQADLKLMVTNTQITFDLTFSALSGPPAMAHVHVGQTGVAGGVSFFLCGGGGKPACPNSTSGEVTGTVAASDIQAITPQGFDSGDLTSVLKAMAAGVTYANIHTQKFPGGEIRGQIVGRHDFGHD